MPVERTPAQMAAEYVDIVNTKGNIPALYLPMWNLMEYNLGPDLYRQVISSVEEKLVAQAREIGAQWAPAEAEKENDRISYMAWVLAEVCARDRAQAFTRLFAKEYKRMSKQKAKSGKYLAERFAAIPGKIAEEAHTTFAGRLQKLNALASAKKRPGVKTP
jgi:hypothetical protein